MTEEPRVTDHEPIIAAARADAGREGARFVHMTIGELWRLIHRGPTLEVDARRQLSAGMQPK